ncbi:MAG TPA: hypothetical protein VFT47_08630 [Vicinamibacterales bacterium]|nr:hypothetical protein [Vicinamibacterales bacterium]
MADFDQIRQQLRAARDMRDHASRARAATQARLKGLAAESAELARTFDPQNPRHAAAAERLRQAKARAESDLALQRGLLASALEDEGRLIRDFAIFTDPREGIARLNDAIPILLLPVRLETRFKGSELWVRVFPDDCWIDTFDPMLTDAEVKAAKAYWTSIWQAGGIEEQGDAAWVALATSHGSGRAAWILQQYQPVNTAARPSKPRAQDVILTIGSEAPLPAGEEAPVAAFWRAAWLSDGDSVQMAAASATLAAAVGAARAEQIADEYVPANFSTPLAPGVTKGDVNLSVAFLTFPVVTTKQTAWSHAPKAVILPDRFVFLGYDAPNDETPVIAIGKPVPSPLLTGPDPSAPKADQLQHDADGNLLVPDELKWMSDFNRAVDVGMGFRIDLTSAQASRGFARVLVIGLRINADEKASQAELETLLRHHAFTQAGLAIVPQGTPTNNTEAVNSGAGRRDDPNASLEDRKQPLFTPESDWLDKKDGQWLAEYLGIDPAVFVHTHQAGCTDQRAARAMNQALWPATLGYWMESMMAPVFPAAGIERTRDFFNRYVIAGGAVPAIRIGSQPYGILPATTLSRMAWIAQRGRLDDPLLGYLRRLYPILLSIDQDFRAKLPEVSFVGKSGDPHALLLDIVGLHPGSVEWSQRYAESLKTFYNRVNLFGLGGLIEKLIVAFERMAARNKLSGLGYGGDQAPPILDLIFNGSHNQLTGGVVDDVPLTETSPIRSYTDDNRNYIQWLIDAAGTSLDALYAQEGFKDGKVPTALLFLFLRHALQLGYHDVSIRLHESAGLYTEAQVLQARTDDPFLHVRDNSQVSESRYQPLYAVAPAITGGGTLAVHEYIAAQIAVLPFARALREQLDALERLKGESTARLERVFADHVDCCAYRLDAWLLGLVNYQLGLMRNIRDGAAVPARTGIYLGGYAWLENVAPERKALEPVRLTDEELIGAFDSAGEPPLMRDPANQGYVHAPSLNHAVAAAVLRNGFISNASAANRRTLAVNLTSERVRTALAFIEGIRAGQSLSDLLGYQFERGLHDRHAMAEVDKYIFKLRKEFPIRADRLQSTKTAEGVPIEAIEARNVINGLALVEHIKATNQTTYPFGKASLPPVTTQDEADAINAEVDRLLESHDAVADLALSEGVYQAVVGNYDRVASTYDAYARGNFPPEPDVVRTPLNGVGLTHRVALHLAAGANPTASPVVGLAMTPRAQAEPALNLWLSATLPPLDQIACRVTFTEAATGINRTREVTLRNLALQAADLLLLIRDDTHQAMTELDDRVVQFVDLNFGPRPDAPIVIRYTERQAAPFTVFEAMPLVRNLRRIATKSRPLEATDLTLMNEAESTQNSQPFVDKTRLDLVRTSLQTLRTDFAAFKAALDVPLADVVANRAQLLTDADSYASDVAALLARAAAFSIPQAGWGFTYDFRRRTYIAILEKCQELVDRWDAKLVDYNGRLAAAAAADTDEQKVHRLAEAERFISTTLTTPSSPAAYLATLTGIKEPAFVAKKDLFAAIATSTRTSVSLLLADVQALLPITDFDFGEVVLSDIADGMVRFAQDVSALSAVMLAEIDRRLTVSNDLFAQHDASAVPTARVKLLDAAARALLTEEFRLIPEFDLQPDQGTELANALAASRNGDLFLYLTAPPEPERAALDFPVDTWLSGVARVREKMFAWEQAVTFATALGRPEPALDPLQLPFVADDRWLAMEIPPDQKLDKDRLLYTAHFAAPFNAGGRQCGVLIDEWTETIPTSSVDTGIVFHHDRPNCEAPQAMLLVTPSEFRGSWRWEDLVGALNETLDFAKRRAIEPRHIDASPYAPFLPATVVATQVQQLTIALELALNNRIALQK